MFAWIKSNQKILMQITSLLVMAGTITLLCFSLRSAPEIVYFDLKSTHQSFSEQLSKRTDIAEVQKNRLAQHFGQSIEAVTQDYAQKNHAIVLVKPAVIAGSRDITRELQQAILQRMQQDG